MRQILYGKEIFRMYGLVLLTWINAPLQQKSRLGILSGYPRFGFSVIPYSSFSQFRERPTAFFQPFCFSFRIRSSIAGKNCRSNDQFLRISSWSRQYPHRKTCQIGCPQRCRLNTAGPFHPHIQKIGLKLHQKIIGAGPSVHFERT